MRIAFVCGSLARYNVGLLQCLTRRDDVHVTVLQMAERDRNREWRYSLDGLDVKTLNSISIPLDTWVAGPETYHIAPGLVRELRRGSYDVLLTVSWTQAYTLLTLAAAKALRRPVILVEVSIPHRPSLLKRAAMPAIRQLMGSFDGCIAGSSKCREYLLSLGCRPEQTHLVRHPIDLERFQQDLTPAEKRAARGGLGLSAEATVVLFVGQYIQRKGVVELLEAWRQLQLPPGTEAVLVLVGSGELEAYIRQFIAHHNLHNTVRVTPYLQHAELRSWYGAADIFVMPSRYEAYGVVAGEAMASGLPVITTSAAGAEPDLVQHEVNGIVIPPNDAPALEVAMKRLITDAMLRAHMSRRAHERAALRKTQDIASEFAQAISVTVAGYRRRARVE